MLALKMTIGTRSERTQGPVLTIRYYEQIGLLPQPERTSKGHRYFRQEDLERLIFIKRCRDSGFPIDQVSSITGLTTSCGTKSLHATTTAPFPATEVRRT